MQGDRQVIERDRRLVARQLRRPGLLGRSASGGTASTAGNSAWLVVLPSQRDLQAWQGIILVYARREMLARFAMRRRGRLFGAASGDPQLPKVRTAANGGARKAQAFPNGAANLATMRIVGTLVSLTPLYTNGAIWSNRQVSVARKMESTAAQHLEVLVHEFYENLNRMRREADRPHEENETVYALGYNLFSYGQYAAAKDIFESLTADVPFRAYYWRALGAVHQQMASYREAIYAYDRAIAIDEDDVIAYVYRGESKLLLREIPNARQDFLRVLRLEEKLGGTPSPKERQKWVARARMLLFLHGPAAET